MTFLLGIKFIVKPVMTTEGHAGDLREKACDPVHRLRCHHRPDLRRSRAGGMMMLLVSSSVLGYELKTAVGTSVFIMTFTALTVLSPLAVGRAPDSQCCPLRPLYPALGPYCGGLCQ